VTEPQYTIEEVIARFEDRIARYAAETASHHEEGAFVTYRDHTAAIAAAEARGREQGLQVKPLEWNDCTTIYADGSGRKVAFGHAPLTQGYTVYESPSEGLHVISGTTAFAAYHLPDLEAAKVAAQADYAEWIATALIPADGYAEGVRTGMRYGEAIAIAAIEAMPGAGPFRLVGKDDDWRFRANLARKEALDAAVAYIRLAFEKNAPPPADGGDNG
jgi:hypothetical protein